MWSGALPVSLLSSSPNRSSFSLFSLPWRPLLGVVGVGCCPRRLLPLPFLFGGTRRVIAGVWTRSLARPRRYASLLFLLLVAVGNVIRGPFPPSRSPYECAAARRLAPGDARLIFVLSATLRGGQLFAAVLSGRHSSLAGANASLFGHRCCCCSCTRSASVP